MNTCYACNESTRLSVFNDDENRTTTLCHWCIMRFIATRKHFPGFCGGCRCEKPECVDMDESGTTAEAPYCIDCLNARSSATADAERMGRRLIPACKDDAERAEWWAAAWAMYAKHRPLWRARVRRMKARAEKAAERVAVTRGKSPNNELSRH